MNCSKISNFLKEQVFFLLFELFFYLFYNFSSGPILKPWKYSYLRLDAGDNVKFTFPGAAAATLLAWGVVEFGDTYKTQEGIIFLVAFFVKKQFSLRSFERLFCIYIVRNCLMILFLLFEISCRDFSWLNRIWVLWSGLDMWNWLKSHNVSMISFSY